jgi:hypothetical protein
MLIYILIAGGLASVTMAIHAAGFSALLRAMMRSRALATAGSRPGFSSRSSCD